MGVIGTNLAFTNWGTTTRVIGQFLSSMERLKARHPSEMGTLGTLGTLGILHIPRRQRRRLAMVTIQFGSFMGTNSSLAREKNKLRGKQRHHCWLYIYP